MPKTRRRWTSDAFYGDNPEAARGEERSASPIAHHFGGATRMLIDAPGIAWRNRLRAPEAEGTEQYLSPEGFEQAGMDPIEQPGYLERLRPGAMDEYRGQVSQAKQTLAERRRIVEMAEREAEALRRKNAEMAASLAGDKRRHGLYGMDEMERRTQTKAKAYREWLSGEFPGLTREEAESQMNKEATQRDAGEEQRRAAERDSGGATINGIRYSPDWAPMARQEYATRRGEAIDENRAMATSTEESDRQTREMLQQVAEREHGIRNTPGRVEGITQATRWDLYERERVERRKERERYLRAGITSV